MHARVTKLALPIAAAATVILMLVLATSCSKAPAPKAHFDASPTEGGAPMAVQFHDRSSGEITWWRWSFGDGAVSTQRNPVHTYETAGSFTVLLDVTGPGGSDKASKTHYIKVLSIQQQANKERAAAVQAISDCLRAAGANELDSPFEGWDGTAGSVTAGGGASDASDYLPAGTAPFRAKYDVEMRDDDLNGNITFGVDVSWGGLIWDDTHERWLL